MAKKLDPEVKPEMQEEDLEAQLKALEGEPQPEPEPALPEGQVFEPEGDLPPAAAPEPEPDTEQLRRELENLQAALKEERDRRKGSEKTLGSLVDRLEQARQIPAQPPAQPQQEELTPEEEFVLGVLQKRLGPVFQQHQAMWEMSQRGHQERAQASAWEMKAKEFGDSNKEFAPALKHLGQKILTKAQTLFPDSPEAQQQYIGMQTQAIVQFAPDRLYDYIVKTEGYTPQAGQPAAATPMQSPVPPINPPKSLSNVPGTSPSGGASLQARADKILQADWKELLKLPADDFDSILKNLGT